MDEQGSQEEIEALGKKPPHASGLAFRGIKYRPLKNYKYELLENKAFQTEIFGFKVSTDFCYLNPEGRLVVFQTYAWDGASGPMPDIKSVMVGSLLHDVIYQLIRLGLLPESVWKQANQELFKQCVADGMNLYLAKTVRWAVGTRLARRATTPESDNEFSEVLTAP